MFNILEEFGSVVSIIVLTAINWIKAIKERRLEFVCSSFWRF